MEIKKIKQMLTEWNTTRSISLGSEILEQLVKDFGIKQKGGSRGSVRRGND